MICDICGVREATVHFTEVVNDKVTKYHLCEECAKTKSEEMQSHFGLSDLLSGLMDLSPAFHDSDVEGLQVKCSRCGMKYRDFQEKGKLGCGECYSSFEKDLGQLLMRIHGSDRHVGKMPFIGEESIKDQQDLQELKNELRTLVRNEEFEKAALIRDKIKDLEKELGLRIESNEN